MLSKAHTKNPAVPKADRVSSTMIDASPALLKGVGPALVERLAEKGLRTLSDLLFFLPRGYEDRRAVQAIAQLQPGQRALAHGRVVAAGMAGFGRGRRYEIAIDDDTGVLRLVFFNFNPYRMKLEYKRNEPLWVFGLVSAYRGARQMAHPEVSRVPPGDESLVGVYSEVPGIHRRRLRGLILQALDLALPEVDDPLPTQVLRDSGLPDLRASLAHLHRPSDSDDVPAMIERRSRYHRRLAFDEFFHLQVLLAQKRSRQQSRGQAEAIDGTGLLLLAEQLLPFSLTGAQARVAQEIQSDLARPQPMARLLQGDVGSGKTAVAALALIAAAQAGLQGAILVPTEILAEQHLRTLRPIFEKAECRVALLTGSTKAAQRREILRALSAGELDAVVGTHALLQDDVQFDALAMVIIDEQHRFGVLQRAALSQRGPLRTSGSASSDGPRLIPHQLVMTATPIPRSLSMTLYGDLALSVIDELPPGRSPVATSLISTRATAALHKAIDHELQAGGQVFVVYPLVEESDKLDLADATQGAEQMRAMFPEVGVGLVTGRMRGAEKDAVMARFAAAFDQILVATTVIEVGIDVPQATLMVVFNAERFGLSQLHQLRGRVGRGQRSARCLLVHGGAGGKEAWRRLKVMQDSSDGFVIAEADLEIRGPGDLLGTRQAGLPSFAFADLVKHGAILEQARQAAQNLVAQDPELKAPQHQALRDSLAGPYAAKLGLLQAL